MDGVNFQARLRERRKKAVTEMPACDNSTAAANPAIPAPATTTDASLAIKILRLLPTGCILSVQRCKRLPCLYL